MTTTLELIQAINSKEPIEAERVFNTIMADRIADKIEDMKLDVAKNFFNARQDLEDSIDQDSGTEVNDEAESV